MKKFEFVLYINSNIICQRFFSIKNFNQKILNSLELKDCVDDCVKLIEDDLKEKTYEYLYKNYNPYKEQTKEEIVVENIYENEDIFDFEIKIDDKCVVKKRFTGNVYPQRVRYSVDVRKIIPALIKQIQETFSSEYFSVEHSGITQ
jgi:hypothetical protein